MPIFSFVVADSSSLFGSAFPSPSSKGGVSSPLTEDAEDPFCDAFLEASLEAGVFFLSVPASARFAWRAAFDAETMLGGVLVVSRQEKNERKKKDFQSRWDGFGGGF